MGTSPIFCLNLFFGRQLEEGATLCQVGGLLFRVIVCLSLDWYRIFAGGAFGSMCHK